jgi:hypothetical protein
MNLVGVDVWVRVRRYRSSSSDNQDGCVVELCGRIVADESIDRFAKQIGMAIMPGVLFDHVRKDIGERRCAFAPVRVLGARALHLEPILKNCQSWRISPRGIMDLSTGRRLTPINTS